MAELLPPSIEQVRVPPFLSPSAVSTINGCLLRLVVQSERNLHRLPVGLKPTIGTLVHSVLEALGREKELIPLQEKVRSIFDRELESLENRLQLDSDLVHMVPLREAMGEREWARHRAYVIKRAEALLPIKGHRGELDKGKVGTTSDVRALPIGATWTEVAMQSPRLRLRGRVDRITRDAPHIFSIFDFKTRSAMSPNGELRESIRIQMLCYGALLTEVVGRSVQIYLIVDDGEIHEVFYDHSEAEKEIEAFIGRLSKLGAAGSELAAKTLAIPSADCSVCSFRHRCSSYLAKAPEWWIEPPEEGHRIPLDIWGRLQSVKASGPYLTLDLIDSAGRRVRIQRISRRHGIESSREGTRLHLFGLQTISIPRDSRNRPRMPINFYEIPADMSMERAWSLKTFADGARNPE